MKFLKDNWIFIVVLILGVILVRTCEQEPKVITKTNTVYKSKTDTITKIFIDEKVKTVFVERIKTEKGKDSIVYRDKPTDTTIESNQYDARLESNNAIANIKITTTGQLLDVTGTIEWKEKETVTTTTILKPKSGLFIYAETSVMPTFKRAAIGLDYQIRNTLIVGTSMSYDQISKQTYTNVKLGVRIF